MYSYIESLETAKKIIEESTASPEDKAFLNGLIPKLSPDMLEVFLWTIEEDPDDISLLVQKTRRLVAFQNDETELKKAVEADKKALEELLEAEESFT